MRETCTLAVFSAMNSAAPICRLVAPSATSASTWRSRGVRSNGSSASAASRSPPGEPRPLDRTALLRRGVEPLDLDAGAGDRAALVFSLAQVPRALRDVGLHPRARGGDPRDVHHVVRAQLHPVQRVLDRGTGLRQLAAAAELLPPH